MDGRLALIHINNYLNYDLVFDSLYYQCIDTAITYMKGNPTDPESIYLSNFIEQSKKDIHSVLQHINDFSVNKTISDPEILDYYIKSRIPFKSDSQHFLLSLICRYTESSSSNLFTFREIFNFLLSNKYINDSELLKSLEHCLTDEYLYFDIFQNKNGNDDFLKYIALRNQYVNGVYTVGTSNFDDEKYTIGAAAEQEFYNNLKKIRTKDELIIWVSRNVNKYAPLDFILYNLRRQFATIHEVKGTISGDTCEAYITREETKTLDKTLSKLNSIYVTNRIKMDANLKGITDFSAFRVYSAGKLELLDIEGHVKNGYGILYGKNASDTDFIAASNIPLLFPESNNGQSFVRLR